MVNIIIKFIWSYIMLEYSPLGEKITLSAGTTNTHFSGDVLHCDKYLFFEDVEKGFFNIGLWGRYHG